MKNVNNIQTEYSLHFALNLIEPLQQTCEDYWYYCIYNVQQKSAEITQSNIKPVFLFSSCCCSVSPKHVELHFN